MGLRFRKSVGLGKGFRVNINKNSIGVSGGRKGMRYSMNTDGRQTVSVGIPGTGIYYTKSSKLKILGKILPIILVVGIILLIIYL